MIKSLLPTGLFGVMAAALMAALMGNLASAANSISTLFSYDLWKRFRPDTPEHRLVVIGRTATFLSFVVGIALVPLLGPVREHLRGDKRRDRPHGPADHVRFRFGRVLAKGIRPQRQVYDVAGLGPGVVLFALKTLACVEARPLRLSAAFLLRNALHDDGFLHVLRLRGAPGGA